MDSSAGEQSLPAPLHRGERLLWSGPPDSNRWLFSNDRLLVPFSLLWGRLCVLLGSKHARGRGRDVLAVLLPVVTCVALAGCGAGATAGSSRGRGATPRRGGTLVAWTLEDLHSLDPGNSYFAVDYPIIYATQRPLYSVLPGSAQRLVPDLAAGLPTISDHGQTVTVQIRRGIRFSPPVDRAVTSADVAYAVERGANPHVRNPYFGSYFALIRGASTADGGPIAGISTPGPFTIVFHLVRPAATFFSQALALPLTAPVPASYARPLDAKDPSQYQDYEVATGPYVVENNSAGRVVGVGYRPGRSVVLVRNPNWNRQTDYRPAYLNRIVIRIGGNANTVGHDVLTGSDMVLLDGPSAAVLQLAQRSYPRQLTLTPGASVGFVWLNLASPGEVNIRRAWWAALDRTAMVAAAGGSAAGTPATHFLYPGVPGFAQAGGLPGPQVPYNRDTSGSLTVAEHYMRLAGYPTGRFTGHDVINVIGLSGPDAQQAKIVADAIDELGFQTRLELSDNPDQVCNEPTRSLEACPTIGSAKDFNDPETVLAPSFAEYPDPQIRSAIAHAELVTGSTARANAWAGVDRLLVNQAVAIPWIFQTADHIRSSDVKTAQDQWNEGITDLDFTSLN